MATKAEQAAEAEKQKRQAASRRAANERKRKEAEELEHKRKLQLARARAKGKAASSNPLGIKDDTAKRGIGAAVGAGVAMLANKYLPAGNLRKWGPLVGPALLWFFARKSPKLRVYAEGLLMTSVVTGTMVIGSKVPALNPPRRRAFVPPQRNAAALLSKEPDRSPDGMMSYEQRVKAGLQL